MYERTTTLSTILDNIGTMDNACSFQRRWGYWFFGIGLISATFHWSGTWASVMKLLMILANGEAYTETISREQYASHETTTRLDSQRCVWSYENSNTWKEQVGLHGDIY